MGGVNPYISEVRSELPQQRYEVTFVAGDGGAERTVEVDPERLPYGHDGLPGSLLDVALGHGVELDHACGGVCACATCHVIVLEGARTMPAASDDEQDQLDLAANPQPESRLACQCVPDGSAPVKVLVPEWNRNLVRE